VAGLAATQKRALTQKEMPYKKSSDALRQ